MFISTVISGLLLGWISDHVGRKFALVLCFVIMAIVPLLAFFAQSLAFFYIVFILTGIIHGSFWSVFLAFSLEFGDNQTRPVYIGLVNTLIAPSTLVAQLLGGWIADGFSYQTTFVLAAVFALITALISIVFVKMPHKRMVLDPA
ncbi:MAG TPA: MFS transporter [Chloroflexi bacterium]|nr:MFS transporter [Chloroflexota bacterium]